MRKLILLTLTLVAASLAPLTPKAEALKTCSWSCGECGLVCLCDECRGPVPYCVCS